MNKKGFTLMQFVIATIVFSGVIALFVLAIGAMDNEYDAGIVNPDFSSQFDKFDEDVDRAGEMWSSTTGEEGLKLIGTVELIFFSTFRVIGLVFEGVVEAGRQLFGFGEYFGVPSAVSTIFFTLLFGTLTVIIIFKILSFVKGGRDL